MTPKVYLSTPQYPQILRGQILLNPISSGTELRLVDGLSRFPKTSDTGRGPKRTTFGRVLR
jgi:hypothetical protein